MGAPPRRTTPPPHRLDEFPAGYSSAGCAPAEPASASPAGNQYALKSSCRSSILQRTANSVLTVCLTPGDHRTMPQQLALQSDTEPKGKNQAFLTTQTQQHLPSSKFTKIEKNLASLGFFTPSSKRVRDVKAKTINFTRVDDRRKDRSPGNYCSKHNLWAAGYRGPGQILSPPKAHH